MRPFRRPAVHDPEEAASRYVDGGIGRRWRERFEAHLLDCEDCWEEVRAARVGRFLAERARELAPAGLREDIRANVSLSSIAPRRRWATRIASAVLVLAVGMGGVSLLLMRPLDRGRQPEAIRAALAAYRADRVPSVAAGRPAPDLGAAGLRLIGGSRESLEGIPADVFRFVDAGGSRVFVFLSDRAFPEASDATERVGAVHGWRAVADGVHMACADAPVSYLVLGQDPSLVRLAEDELQAQPLTAPGG